MWDALNEIYLGKISPGFGYKRLEEKDVCIIIIFFFMANINFEKSLVFFISVSFALAFTFSKSYSLFRTLRALDAKKNNNASSMTPECE